MIRTEFVAALRDMDLPEIDAEIARMRGELFHERNRAAMLKNEYSRDGDARKRELQRDLARALTIRGEREVKR